MLLLVRIKLDIFIMNVVTCEEHCLNELTYYIASSFFSLSFVGGRLE